MPKPFLTTYCNQTDQKLNLTKFSRTYLFYIFLSFIKNDQTLNAMVLLIIKKLYNAKMRVKYATFLKNHLKFKLLLKIYKTFY